MKTFWISERCIQRIVLSSTVLKMLVKPFTGNNFAWNFEIVFSMYDSDTDTNHTSTQCHYI